MSVSPLITVIITIVLEEIGKMTKADFKASETAAAIY